MLGPRNPDQNKFEAVVGGLSTEISIYVVVRGLIPVGSRVKKMISDSWRAVSGSRRGIHSLCVFLGISEATGKWGGST